MAVLEVREEGLSLVSGSLVIRGDFRRMLRRISGQGLNGELLVRAAFGRKKTAGAVLLSGADPEVVSGKVPLAIDATAGLGEDSLLLAAAGFRVKMYERDPVIAVLLRDALARASEDPELEDIAARMELIEGDSVEAMKAMAAAYECPGTEGVTDDADAERPEVILLDPMFPEKTKNSLTKKKLQLIRELEKPCDNEEELLEAAIAARPGKIIVKRPVKGPYLAGKKPSYSITGKTVRYDCIVL